MSLRINHNTNALSAHRNLTENNRELSRSLEKLSSGLKINHASDGPAALVISEQMRSQIAGLNQALSNSETAISLVQTAEGAFTEVNRMLINMRQLAIHAANEGVNDEVMLHADQQEVINMLGAIDRIAQQTQFGTKTLLDGSNGANGAATGEGVEFVKASINTQESTSKGYDVRIEQAATQGKVTGKVALTQDMVNAGEVFMVQEGGKTATYTTSDQDTAKTAVQNLSSAMQKAGLQLDVSLNEQSQIELKHEKYGSKPTFQFSSSTAGVLSTGARLIESAQTGLDVKGTINGEAAKGDGQLLTGLRGSENVEGLTIRYVGDGIKGIGDPGEVGPDGNPLPGIKVGNIFVAQNSLTFQVGGNRNQTVGISLLDTSAGNLGKGLENTSGFRSLSDVNLLSAEGAQNSLLLIDHAINEVTTIRADLGAFQKNTLEGNLSNLRIATENLTAAESIIRDVDVAAEMATFTRNQIMTESATAMLSHASRSPKSVLKLIT